MYMWGCEYADILDLNFGSELTMNTVNWYGFWYNSVNLFPAQMGGGVRVRGVASDEDIKKNVL